MHDVEHDLGDLAFAIARALTTIYHSSGDYMRVQFMAWLDYHGIGGIDDVQALIDEALDPSGAEYLDDDELASLEQGSEAVDYLNFCRATRRLTDTGLRLVYEGVLRLAE